MKSIYIVVLSLVLGFSTCFAQGFTPPQDGKAVVYFARVSSMGFMVSFDFFDNDQYIGKVKSSSYVRYECEAGEHLFWLSGENKAFMTAELKAGETYVAIVDVHMGAVLARAGWAPITSESKTFKRSKKLILRAKPLATSQKLIDKKMKKLESNGWIKERLNVYETKLKGTERVKHIVAEMAIPKDSQTK